MNVETLNNVFFEKFEILDIIKQDEYAGVYIANHIFLGKKIFLKSLNTSAIKNKEIIERFKREAKLLAKLEHPNIIKVYDFGAYENYFYISFEFFKSENLREKLNGGKITEEEKFSYLTQLFEGLKYAHENKIIHRDLKPENLLIDEAGNLKLGDFGLALSLTDNFVTSKFGIVGTPAYMSPEQIAGKKCSRASDIFSAGIIVYELFSGVNPFFGKDVNESINNIQRFDENIFEMNLQALPEKVREIIRLTLRKSIDERANSCGDILSLLRGKQNEEVKSGSSSKYFFAAVILIAASVFIGIGISQIGGSNNKSVQPQSGEIVRPAAEPHAAREEKRTNIKISAAEKSAKNENPVNIKPAKAEKPASDSPEKTKSESAALKFGFLSVKCFPWGFVYLDSVKLGSTPFNLPVKAAAGRHILKITNPKFPAYEKEIFLKPNRKTEMVINLSELWAYVDCEIFPWGKIYLNNKFIAETPLPVPLKIEPGRYSMTITNPSFKDFDTSFTAVRNDTLLISHKFKKQRN